MRRAVECNWVVTLIIRASGKMYSHTRTAAHKKRPLLYPVSYLFIFSFVFFFIFNSVTIDSMQMAGAAGLIIHWCYPVRTSINGGVQLFPCHPSPIIGQYSNHLVEGLIYSRWQSRAGCSGGGSGQQVRKTEATIFKKCLTRVCCIITSLGPDYL